MKVYTFHHEQTVSASLDEVFAFFERPENLQELTPTSLDFEFLTPSPIPMKEGALIDYALRVHGLPVHWRTLITEYEPPHRFVDEQLKGPYLFWHHTHEFEAVDGGTKITDTVRYAMPFGAIGRIVHSVLVKGDLERIFAFRERLIARRFGELTVRPDTS